MKIARKNYVCSANHGNYENYANEQVQLSLNHIYSKIIEHDHCIIFVVFWLFSYLSLFVCNFHKYLIFHIKFAKSKHTNISNLEYETKQFDKRNNNKETNVMLFN